MNSLNSSGASNVVNLLKERHETHGDYRDTAAIAQELKAALRRARWDELTDMQRESLEMIQTKIARIISGDAGCEDHYRDIAGYAMLSIRSV